MKVVTALLHLAVDDEVDPKSLVVQMTAGAAKSQCSFLTQRPLEPTWDAEIELGVSAHLFQVGSYCRRDEEAVHRQVLMDLAQPDPTRSARRWALIKQLHELWHKGWEPETGGKKRPKGQPSFHETEEGQQIAAMSGWLHSLERHTACVLDWPVWQEGQHCEVLDEDGVLWDAEVRSFDTHARTVEVRMWAHQDVMGTIKSNEGVFRTVTVEQIEAGKAEDERLEEIRRQAHAARPPDEPKKKTKKRLVQIAEEEGADVGVAQTVADAQTPSLFDSIPTAE